MSTQHAQSPFIAFVNDAKDTEALKAFADKQGWPDSCIMQGNISNAAEFLKSHTSPLLLLVEISSATQAKDELDTLAEVCDPATKVIVTGTVNEYSFYCWLMDIGIFSYLLKPLTDQALEGAYAKSMESPQAGGSGNKLGKLIAVLGTRGGVGATAVTINLAGVIADLSKKNVALVDLDPQEGSVALALDLEPSRGLREALEKPDRIDSLFIERVMGKTTKNLAILSAEEALQEHLNIHDQAASSLIKELRGKFDIVVLDVPRYLNTFDRECLRQADAVVLVTELTLLGLRDALRLSDLMRDVFKLKPPIVVANRVGMAPKFEMKPAEFEKGINGKIALSIPFAADVYMQISNEIPGVKMKSNPAIKPIYELVQLVMPELKSKAAVKEEKKSGGLFSKKDKG